MALTRNVCSRALMFSTIFLLAHGFYFVRGDPDTILAEHDAILMAEQGELTILVRNSLANVTKRPFETGYSKAGLKTWHKEKSYHIYLKLIRMFDNFVVSSLLYYYFTYSPFLWADIKSILNIK